MCKVLKEHGRARKCLSEDNVHDLRTAIRRCRIIAKSLSAVSPNPEFEKIGRLSKKTFKAMGRLRDLQVMRDWTRSLFKNVKGCGKALKKFGRQEKKLSKRACREIEKFKTGKWRKLVRRLCGREAMTPYLECAFEPYAASLLHRTREAHRAAEKKKTELSYHKLRICFKKFRYFLENFLPDIYRREGKTLEKIQDLLGNYHDLSVLQKILKIRKAAPLIRREQKARIQAYREIVRERNFWAGWEKRLLFKRA